MLWGAPRIRVRQLRDAKIKPLVETFNGDVLDIYAMACGWVLARAHAKVSEVSATISGYLGFSSKFDEAMGKFALACADQAERDYGALKTGSTERNGLCLSRELLSDAKPGFAPGASLGTADYTLRKGVPIRHGWGRP